MGRSGETEARGARKRSRAKAGDVALATDVWRRLSDFATAARMRSMDVLEELDLTPGDMKTLLALVPDEPRPMGALAGVLHCDASNATWLVDRLEDRGLVERRVLPADRRVKTVVLTPEGEKAKRVLLERLYEPPPELLAMGRGVLETLDAALAQLPDTDPPFGSPPS